MSHNQELHDLDVTWPGVTCPSRLTSCTTCSSSEARAVPCGQHNGASTKQAQHSQTLYGLKHCSHNMPHPAML